MSIRFMLFAVDCYSTNMCLGFESIAVMHRVTYLAYKVVDTL